MNSFALWISWRYLVSWRKGPFVSLASLASIVGVTIGVAALIVTMAIMTGFDIDLKDKIIGVNSHIFIEGPQGIDNYGAIIQRIEENRHVVAASAYIQGQALLEYGSRVIGVALRGIDATKETKVNKINQYISQGKLDFRKKDDTRNTIIIGRELANYLGINLGDTLSLVSPFSKNKSFALEVAGIFNSGMYDYDMTLVFIDLSKAQEIFGWGSRVSGIGVRLDDIWRTENVRRQLQQELGFSFLVRTWMELNRNFFSALKLEKFTMFVILTLIILVASLNIISTLVVLVTEKTKDIGILKALGSTKKDISRIFTLEGLLIGLIGTVLGLGTGLVICFLLERYQFVKLPSDIYYLDRVPVYIQWQDVLAIILSALAISFLATLYPSRVAASLEPVAALRYE